MINGLSLKLIMADLPKQSIACSGPRVIPTQSVVPRPKESPVSS